MATVESNVGGFRLADSIPTDVFYGMRLNPLTGHLDIEVIAQGNGVIRLPNDELIDTTDYRQWIWTPATLNFAFSENGHLEMTVL
jgi:hypothetical protein